MKKYNLDVRNWGDDVYVLASKGHHDIDSFKIKCFSEYKHIAKSLKNCDCPCEHLWYKAVPRNGYDSYYTPVSKGCKGSFPVTVWWGA